MSNPNLKDVAKIIADIDFTMLHTHTGKGLISARPMSNNGDVNFDGDSYFFAWEHSRMVADIARDPQVSLALQGKAGLFGKPPLMISIQGAAEVIRDKAQFEDHWQEALSRWFKDGVDTPGLVMLKVHARRINYWDGEDAVEVLVDEGN